MDTYAERLAWAMSCADMDPTARGSQSRLAELVGDGCKPQNIQALLNPETAVKSSKYTLGIARALKCDPYWLEMNDGIKPIIRGEAPVIQRYEEAGATVLPIVQANDLPAYYWPFRTPVDLFRREITLDNLEDLNRHIEAMIARRSQEVVQPRKNGNGA